MNNEKVLYYIKDFWSVKPSFTQYGITAIYNSDGTPKLYDGKYNAKRIIKKQVNIIKII